MTKRGRTQKPWTDSEKRQLAEMYVAHVDVAEIARRLGRPFEGVRSKAQHLGLRRSAKGNWTEDEVAILKAEYATCGHPREIAAKLGRPLAAGGAVSAPRRRRRGLWQRILKLLRRI